MRSKNLSIDQGQRKVRSSLCCNWFYCHVWWDVVSDHWSNGNFSQVLRRVFQVKNCWCIFDQHYCHESIQFSDIFRRLFFCEHLAVGRHHRRRTFRDPYGFQFSKVKVFPADHVHAALAPESTTNFLSFEIAQVHTLFQSSCFESRRKFSMQWILGKMSTRTPSAPRRFDPNLWDNVFPKTHLVLLFHAWTGSILIPPRHRTESEKT